LLAVEINQAAKRHRHFGQEKIAEVCRAKMEQSRVIQQLQALDITAGILTCTAFTETRIMAFSSGFVYTYQRDNSLLFL